MYIMSVNDHQCIILYAANNKILTLIISTIILCSASLRAIQARIPWPNGNTRYGLMSARLALRVQRSGKNDSQALKYFGNRQAIIFCVTVTVCGRKTNYITGTLYKSLGGSYSFGNVVTTENHIIVDVSSNSNGDWIQSKWFLENCPSIRCVCIEFGGFQNVCWTWQ